MLILLGFRHSTIRVSIPIVRTPACVTDMLLCDERGGWSVPYLLRFLQDGLWGMDALLSSLFKTGGHILPQHVALETGQHVGLQWDLVSVWPLLLCLLQNNPHKLTLSMTPDDKYPEKQAQMETEKLKQKVNSLSPKDKQQIYEKGRCFHPNS